jgi:hypothetical protein
MRDTLIQPVFARRLHELEQTFAAVTANIDAKAAEARPLASSRLKD